MKLDHLKGILESNAREYYENGVAAESRRQFNTAVTLYFKALSCLCDLFILAREEITPSSHSQRFRILQLRYPRLYKMLDKDFPFYQDSYRARLDRETAEMLRDDVTELCHRLGIDL